MEGAYDAHAHSRRMAQARLAGLCLSHSRPALRVSICSSRMPSRTSRHRSLGFDKTKLLIRRRVKHQPERSFADGALGGFDERDHLGCQRDQLHHLGDACAG